MDLNLLFNKALEFFEIGIVANMAHIAALDRGAPPLTVAAEVKEAAVEANETPAGWNPFAEKVMGRYDKAKTEILDIEIKNRGVKVKDKATGAEKHQALLDHMAKEMASGELEGSTGQPETAPPAADDFGGDDFGAEEAPKAKKYTQAEVRDALTAWRDKNHAGDNAAVRDLLTKIAGTANFPAVKEEQYPAVMAALEA